MTDSIRQNVLKNIIDKKLMNKAEIISDLQFKVDYNGKKAGNENEKKKWENDILFVSTYTDNNIESTTAEFVSPNK